MQVVVTVIDQNGTPTQGVGIDILDLGAFIAGGETDANGQFISPDLPFPTDYGSDSYTITAYSGGTPTSVSWFGEYSLTLQLGGTPPSGASGTINAIRVHDVSKNVWFSWDNGSWGATGSPSVNPGASNLYIAFNVVNTGGSAGILTLRVTDSLGALLASIAVYTPTGGNAGIEWTGNMPSASYGITLSVTP